jgi:cilia- and flagella-associated protein 57
MEQHREFDQFEETLALAFHPSGFHLVVAFADKILCMNILSNSIVDFNLFQMKDCRELRFSNGGHLFAASTSTGSVQVWNFWTGISPSKMQIKGHSLKVRSIEWFQNDEGLCTAAMDGNCYFYDLISSDELQSNRNLEHDFHQKGCGFTGMCLMP